LTNTGTSKHDYNIIGKSKTTPIKEKSMMSEYSYTRRGFLKSAGLGFVVLSLPGISAFTTLRSSSLRSTSAKKRNKPNILFIFADDQCFETLRSMGCDEIQTPNLDRLVRNGVTFTHAYNQGSWVGAVCVASRTMLNTGRFLWIAREFEPKLKEETKAGRFWSQYMSKAGYETYMSGKWHVKGIKPKDIFDYVKDVRPGMPNQTPQGYSRPIEGIPDMWKPWDKKYGGYWKGGKHWSEVLADNAVEFLENASKSEKPFFMYLAFNAPHDQTISEGIRRKVPVGQSEGTCQFPARIPVQRLNRLQRQAQR